MRDLSLTLDIKFGGALSGASLVLGPAGDETGVFWQSAEDGQCCHAVLGLDLPDRDKLRYQ